MKVSWEMCTFSSPSPIHLIAFILKVLLTQPSHGLVELTDLSQIHDNSKHYNQHNFGLGSS